LGFRVGLRVGVRVRTRVGVSIFARLGSVVNLAGVVITRKLISAGGDN